jgi:hypothetical protein
VWRMLQDEHRARCLRWRWLGGEGLARLFRGLFFPDCSEVLAAVGSWLRTSRRSLDAASMSPRFGRQHNAHDLTTIMQTESQAIKKLLTI